MRIPVKSDLDFSRLEFFLKNEVQGKVNEWDEHSYFPIEIIKELFTLGIFNAPLPKEFGGKQARMIDLLEISHRLAEISPGLFTTWIANILFQTAIYRFADPELAESILKEHLEKRQLTSFCVTERESGTDVANIVTKAHHKSGGFEINGGKYFITNANYSDHLVVMAQLEDKGLTAFYVPASTKGVHRLEPLKKMGQRESNTGGLEFRHVFVPEKNMIGKPGQGLTTLGACISRTKTLIAGASYGLCTASEKIAVEYLNSHIRYKKPLAAKREIQNVLAELHTEAQAAWLLACYAGTVWDRDGFAIKEASMAKLFASDLAVRFTSEAMELCGAHGYMNNGQLDKLYRDAKLFEIYEGASLVQMAFINKSIFGNEKKEARPGKLRSAA